METSTLVSREVELSIGIVCSESDGRVISAVGSGESSEVEEVEFFTNFDLVESLTGVILRGTQVSSGALIVRVDDDISTLEVVGDMAKGVGESEDSDVTESGGVVHTFSGCVISINNGTANDSADGADR